MVAQTKGLTAEQKELFERDGFLVYGPIISTEELEEVRERIDAIADGVTNVPEDRIRLELDYLEGKLPGIRRRDAGWRWTMPPSRTGACASSPAVIGRA